MSIGFIVLRHVNSELTNKYWIMCVESIRKYYPQNEILIIDDNSDYKFVTRRKFYKTSVINSRFPKRGEFLPYYYYLYNKRFDIAVIIHDSVFINKYINFNVERYKFLWYFEHNHDNVEDERRLINVFNDIELSNFYENKKLWKGCFGSMTIIRHDYLTHVNSKYNIGKLIHFILNRTNRSSFERVIACLLQKEGKGGTLLGDITKYCRWGTKFHEMDKRLPIMKCWTGR